MKKLKKQIRDSYCQTRQFFLSRQTQFLFLVILMGILIFLRLSGAPFVSQLLGYGAILFLIFLVALFLFRIKKEILFSLSLVLLLISPLIMIFSLPGLSADSLGNFAYWLLLIGAIEWGLEFFKGD